jgi:hypothetical protein
METLTQEVIENMATLQGRNVPRSGSAALAAGGIVQAILGAEFVLAA